MTHAFEAKKMGSLKQVAYNIYAVLFSNKLSKEKLRHDSKTL